MSDLTLHERGVQPPLPALQAAAGLRPAAIGRAEGFPQLPQLGAVAPQEVTAAQVDRDHQTLVAVESLLHLLDRGGGRERQCGCVCSMNTCRRPDHTFQPGHTEHSLSGIVVPSVSWCWPRCLGCRWTARSAAASPAPAAPCPTRKWPHRGRSSASATAAGPAWRLCRCWTSALAAAPSARSHLQRNRVTVNTSAGC